jgi:hypothetical protein
MASELSVRVMRADEWAVTRAVLVDAFDDPEIGGLRE